jgi:hypothetical protein
VRRGRDARAAAQHDLVDARAGGREEGLRLAAEGEVAARRRDLGFLAQHRVGAHEDVELAVERHREGVDEPGAAPAVAPCGLVGPLVPARAGAAAGLRERDGERGDALHLGLGQVVAGREAPAAVEHDAHAEAGLLVLLEGGDVAVADGELFALDEGEADVGPGGAGGLRDGEGVGAEGGEGVEGGGGVRRSHNHGGLLRFSA